MSTVTPAAPPPLVIRPSLSVMRQLGEFVLINKRLRFRPPTELQGRMAASGRSGQWRGTGSMQRVVGIDVGVYPLEAGVTDVLERNSAGAQTLLAHSRRIAVGKGKVDRLSVNGIAMVRLEMPDTRVMTSHYSAIVDDQVVSFTIRYDASRSAQRDVLEAAVVSLERTAP